MEDHESQIVAADVAISEVGTQAESEAVVDFKTVIKAIINKDLSPEMLREVLTIQRDFNNEAEDRAAKRAFTVALIGLKTDLPAVVGHDRHVKFLQTDFTYTTLAKLVATVTPIMCRHGFTHKWIPSFDGKHEVGITCELEHIGGHVVKAYLPSVPSDKQGMNQAQAVMATQTTLKRNTLLSLLGLATEDMDDDTQPESEVDPDSVDGNENIKAAMDIRRRGLKVPDAEKVVGRKMDKWTTADLGKIWEWVQKQTKEEEPKDPFDSDPDNK